MQDYERLEFLGDSILSFLVARHFFLNTQEPDSNNKRYMPKELHRMKTSVINNALLSLIVIENDIHEFIIYNEKAEAFKRQFEKYVWEVKHHIEQCGSTKEVCDYKNAQRDQERNMALQKVIDAKEFHPTNMV